MPPKFKPLELIRFRFEHGTFRKHEPFKIGTKKLRLAAGLLDKIRTN